MLLSYNLLNVYSPNEALPGGAGSASRPRRSRGIITCPTRDLSSYASVVFLKLFNVEAVTVSSFKVRMFHKFIIRSGKKCWNENGGGTRYKPHLHHTRVTRDITSASPSVYSVPFCTGLDFVMLRHIPHQQGINLYITKALKVIVRPASRISTITYCHWLIMLLIYCSLIRPWFTHVTSGEVREAA